MSDFHYNRFNNFQLELVEPINIGRRTGLNLQIYDLQGNKRGLEDRNIIGNVAEALYCMYVNPDIWFSRDWIVENIVRNPQNERRTGVSQLLKNDFGVGNELLGQINDNIVRASNNRSLFDAIAYHDRGILGKIFKGIPDIPDRISRVNWFNGKNDGLAYRINPFGDIPYIYDLGEAFYHKQEKIIIPGNDVSIQGLNFGWMSYRVAQMYPIILRLWDENFRPQVVHISEGEGKLLTVVNSMYQNQLDYLEWDDNFHPFGFSRAASTTSILRRKFEDVCAFEDNIIATSNKKGNKVFKLNTNLYEDFLYKQQSRYKAFHDNQ